MGEFLSITVDIRKNIFACLLSVHNTISLSHHEQVCLIRIFFERYLSHHRARWEKYLSNRSLIMADSSLLSDSLPVILCIFTELLQRTPLVEFFWLLLLTSYFLKVFSFRCLSIVFIVSVMDCSSAHRLGN